MECTLQTFVLFYLNLCLLRTKLYVCCSQKKKLYSKNGYQIFFDNIFVLVFFYPYVNSFLKHSFYLICSISGLIPKILNTSIVIFVLYYFCTSYTEAIKMRKGRKKNLYLVRELTDCFFGFINFIEIFKIRKFVNIFCANI